MSDVFTNPLLMSSAVAVCSYPFTPQPSEPNDMTHRFYLCRLATDKKDVMECERKLKRDCVEALNEKAVNIKAGCPACFDQVILSSKLNMPVQFPRPQ